MGRTPRSRSGRHVPSCERSRTAGERRRAATNFLAGPRSVGNRRGRRERISASGRPGPAAPSRGTARRVGRGWRPARGPAAPGERLQQPIGGEHQDFGLGDPPRAATAAASRLCAWPMRQSPAGSRAVRSGSASRSDGLGRRGLATQDHRRAPGRPGRTRVWDGRRTAGRARSAGSRRSRAPPRHGGRGARAWPTTSTAAARTPRHPARRCGGSPRRPRGRAARRRPDPPWRRTAAPASPLPWPNSDGSEPSRRTVVSTFSRSSGSAPARSPRRMQDLAEVALAGRRLAMLVAERRLADVERLAGRRLGLGGVPGRTSARDSSTSVIATSGWRGPRDLAPHRHGSRAAAARPAPAWPISRCSTPRLLRLCASSTCAGPSARRPTATARCSSGSAFRSRPMRSYVRPISANISVCSSGWSSSSRRSRSAPRSSRLCGRSARVVRRAVRVGAVSSSVSNSLTRDALSASQRGRDRARVCRRCV